MPSTKISRVQATFHASTSSVSSLPVCISYLAHAHVTYSLRELPSHMSDTMFCTVASWLAKALSAFHFGMTDGSLPLSNNWLVTVHYHMIMVYDLRFVNLVCDYDSCIYGLDSSVTFYQFRFSSPSYPALVLITKSTPEKDGNELVLLHRLDDQAPLHCRHKH